MNPSVIQLPKMISFLITCLMLSASLLAQEQKITEESDKYPTYYFGDPNPLPAFVFNPKIYPYHKFQGYEFEKSEKEFKKITLENQWIEVIVFPEVGGKVWGAIDKSNGNEFIYKNEVAKFRNIAMRGPWTSGGIEFNFGVIGHHPGTGTPADYRLDELPDGSVMCTVGGIDLPSRTQWRVKVILPKDQSAFTTQAVWYNPTDTEQAYYNWMTAAAAAKQDLVFYTPGDQFLTHGGMAKAWPIDPLNRDLSQYNQNNFGPSKSYHVIGEYNDFFGGYYKDSDIGFGHWGRYDEIPGQKLWLWNLSRAGGIWEDLLTDTDGQYVEYQAGRLYVQYFPGEENPISQATFDPHLTDQWTEVWFPVKDIGGIKEASPFGAMNVIETDNSLEVKINAFKATESIVILKTRGKTQTQTLKTTPNSNHILSFPKPWGNYSIDVPGLELHYNTQPALIKRSFGNPEVIAQNTLEKTFLKAKDAQRYRNYPLAEALLKEVIEEDPLHLEARKEMSFLHYRNGDYDQALSIANIGLQIDAYHNGLNYTAGIAYMAQKDWINAKEHLGWAARTVAYRSAANTLLAQIHLIEKKYSDAQHYNDIALKFNAENINALSQKALLYRMMGDKENALQTISEIEEIDPINHFAVYEKYLLGESGKKAVSDSHRSEFPYQTFLELALFYHNRNNDAEAVKILETGPKHLLNSLWLAYLNQNQMTLSTLDNESIAFVFPFRKESLNMLEWVVANNPSWKAQYLKSLNLMGRAQMEKGIQIFKDLGQKPNDHLFYYVRGMLFKEHQLAGYQKDLQRAYKQSPKNWRYAFALAEDHFKSGNSSATLKIIQKIYKQDQDNYFAGMLLAKTLNQLKDYDKAIELLKDLRILPYEHATEGRKIYTNAHNGSALQAIIKGDHTKAAEKLEKALLWPEHLGVGKPFDPEERWERFLMAYLQNQDQQSEKAKKSLEQVAKFSKQQLFKSSKNHLLGVYALAETQGEKEAQQFIAQLLASQHGSSPQTNNLVEFYYTHPKMKWNKNFIGTLSEFLNSK
jgi:lipopolysaccharide biosynthesis regulator YciM